MKKIVKLTLALLVVLFFSTCKKECCQDPTNPKCENYDPCHGVTKANADFTIGEFLGDLRYSDTMFTEADTVYASNTTCFVPKHENDSFIWILGAEEVRSKTLCRSHFPVNRDISVTLITVKNSPCLNGKKQRDTITKRFHTVPHWSQLGDSTEAKKNPFWGTWKGAHTDNPNDEFLVTFGFIGAHPYYNSYPTSMAGLPRDVWPQLPFYDRNSIFGLTYVDKIFLGYNSMLLVGDEWGGRKMENFLIKMKSIVKGNKITINYTYNNKSYTQWLNGVPENEIIYRPVDEKNKIWNGTKTSNQVLR
jgi:hypothetical protein